MTFQKLIFLILLIFSGFILLDHTLFYQSFLAQGDHGRDLYAFAATLRGDLPYRDYWWVYGPLMPFYYAGFLKLFSVSVSSVLLGAFLLRIIGGVFVYLTLTLYGPAFLAYMGALWFMLFRPEFFFTYSHLGGITLLCAFFFCVLSSFRFRKLSYLYGALFCAFLLCLVKINFGLCAYVIFGGAALCHHFDFKTTIRRLTASAALSLTAVALIYFELLKDLPFYAVRQCLPYFKSDHPYNMPVWQGVALWIREWSGGITASPVSMILSTVVAILLGSGIYQMIKGRFDPRQRDFLIASFGVLLISYIFLNHEFFLSGVPYRMFWAYPAGLLIMFISIEISAAHIRRWISILLFLSLLLFTGTQYARHSRALERLIDSGKILNVPNARVLLQNPTEWLSTVEQTTHFLKKTLKNDETFFAMPYEPLYYFLLNRPSPTRQLIFFEHINIPEEQERKVIADLEATKTNYVLVSNRAFYTSEHGLGRFGQTYCPLLFHYIDKNFKKIATFGPWYSSPGWISGHAVKIFQRKP